MKIAHFHWGFPPTIGGVETHLSTILPEMVKMGHKVGLLTNGYQDIAGRYAYKGVKIRRTPIMDLNWLYKRGLESLQEELKKAFTNFLNEMKPDVVHVHNMHYFSKLHITTLYSICEERHVPLVLTAHNVWDDIMFLDVLHSVPWSHIIAVSHYIANQLVSFGCNKNDITVVHHGVDTEMFGPDVQCDKILSRYPQLKGKPVIFHPARTGMAKGSDVTIKAVNTIKEKFPDIMLVLAGTKNIIDWGETQQRDIAYFVKLIELFHLRENVLVDAFTMEQMPQLYAVSSVVVYPSSAPEPFGLTLLESMASCKPIIVTKAGGMPEIIHDGINGYVIRVRDVEALAGCISRLLEDKQLRDRLGKTGLSMVKQQYTIRDVTRNTLDVYSKVLS
jgi:hypothetical protein